MVLDMEFHSEQTFDLSVLAMRFKRMRGSGE